MALELRKVEGSGPGVAAYDAYNASTCVVNALRSALYKVCPNVLGDAKVLINSSTLTNEELTDRIMMIPIVQSTLPSGSVTWDLHVGDSRRFLGKTDIMSSQIVFLVNGKPLSPKPELNGNITIATIRDRQEIHVAGRVVMPHESNGMYSTTIRPRMHTHEKKTTRFHKVDYPLHRLEFEPKEYYTADENLRRAIDYLCEELESVISLRAEFMPADLQTIITIHDTPVFVAELINSDLVSRGYHSSCYRSNPDTPNTIRLMKPGPKGPERSGPKDEAKSLEEVFRTSVEFLLKYLKGKA
jgi:hypothetical protein